MTEETTPNVQWLTQPENDAWVALADLILRLPATLESDLQTSSDLSFYEYMVLAMLSETPDHTLGMGYLATLTSGSLSRLSHVIKRLEKAGYVTRSRSEHDKRHTNAHLTQEGLQKIVASAPGHVSKVRSTVFSGLTAQQVQQLKDIADAIRDNLGSEKIAPCSSETVTDK